MKIFSLFILTLFLLISCGGTKNIKTGAEQSAPSQSVKSDEAPAWFDPNELDENDIHIEKREQTASSVEPEQFKKDVAPEDGNAVNKVVDGFRVQLKAAKSSQKIKEEFRVARSVFNPLGYEVYLIYESPLYKLRLGDATSRKSAEKLLDLAKNKGYRDSWIVPDSVNSALDTMDE